MSYNTMRMNMTLVAVGLVLLVILPEVAEAMPSGIISRQKRVSDQRLAELETLLALSHMKGKYVTVPVAFGRVDPAKIGRRRRSMETGLQRLQRLLQEVARETEATDQEKDQFAPSFWEDLQDRREDESEYQSN